MRVLAKGSAPPNKTSENMAPVTKKMWGPNSTSQVTPVAPTAPRAGQRHSPTLPTIRSLPNRKRKSVTLSRTATLQGTVRSRHEDGLRDWGRREAARGPCFP